MTSPTSPTMKQDDNPKSLNQNHKIHDLSMESINDLPEQTDSGREIQDEFDIQDGPDREIMTVAFGPKLSWFVRWSDAVAAWENLPPTLHSKLSGRIKSLPGVKSLSISEIGHWVVIFEDGSFASSGISVEGKLKDALMDSDSEIKSVVLAPGGGWLLVRENGSLAYERLPTSLQTLLSRRGKGDPPIDQVAISGFGGWFIRFCDGECEWEAIPRPLEKFLIQMIRKGDPNLILSLSPSDGHSYFVAIGDVAEWVHDNQTFKDALECANEGDEALDELAQSAGDEDSEFKPEEVEVDS